MVVVGPLLDFLEDLEVELVIDRPSLVELEQEILVELIIAVLHQMVGEMMVEGVMEALYINWEEEAAAPVVLERQTVVDQIQFRMDQQLMVD